MKRQRGRNRGGGFNNGRPQQNANRAFDSNGPEGIKVRGAAQSVFEKYQQLARDATSAGDRILAENYLQHAEHYFRVLRAVQPNRPVSDIVGRDQFSSGFDIDFEAEPEEGEAHEAPVATDDGESQARSEWRPREDRQRDDRQRDDRQRDDRPREDRARDERSRDDRPRDDRRDDRARDDRPREDRQRDGQQGRNENRRDRWRDRDDRNRDDRPRDDRVRDERPREDRARDDRPRDDRGRDRQRERTDDPLAVVEPRGGALTGSEPRGYDLAPARDVEDQAAPVLRAQDGFESEMPAFLGRAPEPRAPEAREDVVEEVEARPRRTRTRKPRVADVVADGVPAEAEES